MASVDRRLSALAGLLLAIAVIYLALLHWWWTAPMLAMGEEIESLRSEELTLRMEAAQREQLRTALVSLGREIESGQPGFLVERNKELASAALVQRLESVLIDASPSKRCKVTARTPIEAATKEPFTRVVVQVRLNCGMADLSSVLHALESGTPQLFINNLDVLSRRAYLGAGEAASGALDVSFDLYGYLKQPLGGAGE